MTCGDGFYVPPNSNFASRSLVMFENTLEVIRFVG
jgi:hypothetical protein